MKTTLLNLSLFLALPLACFGQAAPAAGSHDPVATVDGQPIYDQDLIQSLGSQWMQVRNQEYQLKSKALDDLIRQKLLEAEATKQGLSLEKLFEREVDSKVAQPTDAEVEAYFLGQQNRNGARFEDVKEQFRSALKGVKIERARQAYADSLRAKSRVAVLLRPPKVEIVYDPGRVRGDPKAPVTIVEFSDFQCPYCKKVESTLKNILAKYDGRVKLAYLDYPLAGIHPQAEAAAEASRCAGAQGKYWEFHDALFADQSKLNEAGLAGTAQSLGLDGTAFQTCLKAHEFKPQVDQDLQKGTRVGLQGTPGFFVDGIFLNGAQPQAEFEKLIDSELAVGRSQNSVQASR